MNDRALMMPTLFVLRLHSLFFWYINLLLSQVAVLTFAYMI